MTIQNLLVLMLVTSLPLLSGGCGGAEDSGVGDGGSVGDGGGEDGGTDLSVPVNIQLPAGVGGRAVIYTNLGDDPYAEVGSCDAATGSCTYTVVEPGTYWVEVEAVNALFLAQEVTVDETGVADHGVISWETGGCLDADWSVELGWCNDWVEGQWAMGPVSSEYANENGDTILVTTEHSADVTGDGVPDIVMTLDNGAEDQYVGSGVFAKSNNDGFKVMLEVEPDLSAIWYFPQGGTPEILTRIKNPAVD